MNETNRVLPPGWIGTRVTCVVFGATVTGYVQQWDSARQRYGIMVPPRLIWVTSEQLREIIGQETSDE